MPAAGFNVRNRTRFGEHRSGWNFVTSLLRGNFHDDGGVLLVDFAEKVWGWDWRPPTGTKHVHFRGGDYEVQYSDLRKHEGNDTVPLPDGGVVTYRDDRWELVPEMRREDLRALPLPGVIGEKFVMFIHNPPGIPEWFDYDNSPQVFMNRDGFQESLGDCEGIYVFSDYLRRWILDNMGVPCPVEVLRHPTGACETRWSLENFVRRPKTLVQVGYWLRRMGAIYKVRAPGYRKVWLYGGSHAFECLAKEAENDPVTARSIVSSDVDVARLSNEEYDDILSYGIVLLDMYDSSCNNAVVECVERETPIAARRLPAVVEYLGPGYPLYFDDLEEAEGKLKDARLIRDAHVHLREKRRDGTLGADAFVSGIERSFIYGKLTGRVRPREPDNVVSLGADCFPRAMLTKHGIGRRKEDGELTGPFDLAFHPPNVVADMIRGDFEGSWDPVDLSINENGHIVHTNGSVYNHESDTPQARDHFSANNFQRFVERYRRRAKDFGEIVASHIESGKELVFVSLCRGYPVELRDALRERHPRLRFYILGISLLSHGASFADTAPNVEHGTEAADGLGFCFYSLRKPFEEYVWHDPSHFSSPRGIAFEERVAEVMSRVFVL